MDGYQVTFTLGELDPQFGNESILVADKRDGKPLPDKQGPFRLVCPNDHEGARSVRMLETLEVVRLAEQRESQPHRFILQKRQDDKIRPAAPSPERVSS
jgi:hypothetical protein